MCHSSYYIIYVYPGFQRRTREWCERRVPHLSWKRTGGKVCVFQDCLVPNLLLLIPYCCSVSYCFTVLIPYCCSVPHVALLSSFHTVAVFHIALLSSFHTVAVFHVALLSSFHTATLFHAASLSSFHTTTVFLTSLTLVLVSFSLQDCHNFHHVLVMPNPNTTASITSNGVEYDLDTTILVCGSNALSPMCHYRLVGCIELIN